MSQNDGFRHTHKHKNTQRKSERERESERLRSNMQTNPESVSDEQMNKYPKLVRGDDSMTIQFKIDLVRLNEQTNERE